MQLSLEFVLFAPMYIKESSALQFSFLQVSLEIWPTFWTSLPESFTATPLQAVWPGRPISEQTLVLTGDVAGLGDHRHLSHTGQTVVYRTHWAIIQQAGHICWEIQLLSIINEIFHPPHLYRERRFLYQNVMIPKKYLKSYIYLRNLILVDYPKFREY